MSNRVITNQQFSDGTTIDGNRIEDALQDTEKFLDKVPSQFVRSRFVENQIVSGFTPIPNGATVVRKHPWMGAYNHNAANTITNEYRLKGYGVVRSDLVSYYIWSQSIQFGQSVIIDAFQLVMAQDLGSSSAHVYKMGSTAYPNYVPPNIDDLELHITIDNMHTPDDRTQNSMEIHKHSFGGQSYLLRPFVSTSAPANDMLPAANGGGLTGYAVTISDLNIPLHANARARFAIVIPEYSGGTGLANWTSTPWSTSVWSQTISVLESNKNV
jgi:hypothetical protein